MAARAQHIREVEDRIKSSLYFALNSSLAVAVVFIIVLAFAFVLVRRQ